MYLLLVLPSREEDSEDSNQWLEFHDKITGQNGHRERRSRTWGIPRASTIPPGRVYTFDDLWTLVSADRAHGRTSYLSLDARRISRMLTHTARCSQWTQFILSRCTWVLSSSIDPWWTWATGFLPPWDRSVSTWRYRVTGLNNTFSPRRHENNHQTNTSFYRFLPVTNS